MIIRISAFFAAVVSAAVITAVSPAAAQDQSLPEAGPLSPQQRDLLRDEIRSYLLDNPEVILEAIEVLETRRESAAAEADRDLVAAHAEQIYEDGFSYIAGNPEGDVTLVEFSDYRCGYCRQAHPQILELVATDPDLRVIIKEFPILGPDSVAVGRMALAALEVDPSRYGALNDALMSYPGNLTETTGYLVAKETGYDVTALKEAAAQETVSSRLEANYALAQTLGLQGTPSFILGGEIIRGFLPIEDMRDLVAAARNADAAAN